MRTRHVTKRQQSKRDGGVEWGGNHNTFAVAQNILLLVGNISSGWVRKRIKHLGKREEGGGGIVEACGNGREGWGLHLPTAAVAAVRLEKVRAW